MIKHTIAVFALSAATMLASDVTGKWAASMETPRGEMKMNFDLKADGDKLTGTVGNDMMGDSEIQDGKVDGDNIEFKQVMKRGDREMKFVYSGKVSGDEIAFTRKMDGAPGGGGPRAEGKGGQGKGGGRGFGGPQEFKAVRAK